MKIQARILTASFAGLILAAQSPATTITVPSAIWDIDVNNPLTRLHSPGTVSVNGSKATAGALPSPYLDLLSTTGNSAAGGDIKYYFEFFGPNGVIPVDLHYSASSSGDPHGGFISAKVTLADSAGGGIDSFCTAVDVGLCGGGLEAGLGSYQGVLRDTLSANVVYQIHLEGEAYGSPSTGAAYVNSVISLDPSFTGNPNAYSLILSDGIGNSGTSAAPEPASAVLIATGIAGIVVLRRRRREVPRCVMGTACANFFPDAG